jgi:hypothetical protein
VPIGECLVKSLIVMFLMRVAAGCFCVVLRTFCRVYVDLFTEVASV